MAVDQRHVIDHHKGMSDPPDLSVPTPDEIEAAAQRIGLSIAALCRKADVAAEIFYRWRSGPGSITTRNLERLLEALRHERAKRGE